MEKSVFQTLNNINVQEHVEQKNGLSYLSWAWAWQEAKKLFASAQYTIYERETEYGPVNYFTDGRTCWVKTGVTIEGLEHIEELPVMDYKNKSITLDKITSFDVNKAIQRSLTKALARHGLGLYIYAGEDLPEVDKQKEEEKKLAEKTQAYTRLRTKMNEIGLDFRDDKFTSCLNKTTGLKTQELQSLKSDELDKLNNFYKGAIQKFQEANARA